MSPTRHALNFKGQIRGLLDAATNGNTDYFAQNITLKNVTLGNNCLSGANKANYFDIDLAATKEIEYECNNQSSSSSSKDSALSSSPASKKTSSNDSGETCSLTTITLQ